MPLYFYGGIFILLPICRFSQATKPVATGKRIKPSAQFFNKIIVGFPVPDF